MSQKFCNILVHAYLRPVYHVAGAFKVVDKRCGW